LIQNKSYIPDITLIKALHTDLKLSELILFINYGLIICDNIISIIIANNNFECYEYLLINHKNAFKINNKLLSNIFILGFKNIINLSFTHLNLKPDNFNTIIPILIKKGLINVLKQIQNYINAIDDIDNTDGIYSIDDVELSIENGNLELFKYIYDNTDFFMEDINNVKRHFIELSIKVGKFSIFNWLFNNNTYIDLNNNLNQDFIKKLINISITYNRTDFFNYIYNFYISKYNVYPKLAISSILGNFNIELLNNYLQHFNEPILLPTKFYIITWIENNQYCFKTTENIYQLIIKNINITEQEFPFIYNRILTYKNKSKILSNLLIKNTILSYDIVNSIILQYLWNI
jgi:hypothetical protein